MGLTRCEKAREKRRVIKRRRQRGQNFIVSGGILRREENENTGHCVSSKAFRFQSERTQQVQ